MLSTRLALLAQLATTLPLVGLIWLVQIVSYPLFSRVGAGAFPAYHEAHARLITPVVGPLMFGELVASFVWAMTADPGVPRLVVWLGFALTVATWLATGLLSVPCHDALAGGLDVDVIGRLVATNWLRTIAWTARGALLLWAVSRRL